MESLSREGCYALLRDAAARLGRLPKRSDFPEAEAARIKALCGPWPRALEAAGVKAPSATDRKAKNRARRIRAKRARRETENATTAAERAAGRAAQSAAVPSPASGYPATPPIQENPSAPSGTGDRPKQEEPLC